MVSRYDLFKHLIGYEGELCFKTQGESEIIDNLNSILKIPGTTLKKAIKEHKHRSIFI